MAVDKQGRALTWAELGSAGLCWAVPPSWTISTMWKSSAGDSICHGGDGLCRQGNIYHADGRRKYSRRSPFSFMLLFFLLFRLGPAHYSFVILWQEQQPPPPLYIHPFHPARFFPAISSSPSIIRCLPISMWRCTGYIHTRDIVS